MINRRNVFKKPPPPSPNRNHSGISESEIMFSVSDARFRNTVHRWQRRHDNIKRLMGCEIRSFDGSKRFSKIYNTNWLAWLCKRKTQESEIQCRRRRKRKYSHFIDSTVIVHRSHHMVLLSVREENHNT